MSWTKTDHEGQTMWERDGERVKEVPDERRVETIERMVYVTGFSRTTLAWAFFVGYLPGGMLAVVLELKL